MLGDDGVVAGHHGMIRILHNHIFAVGTFGGQLRLGLGFDNSVIFRTEHQHWSLIVSNAFQ